MERFRDRLLATLRAVEPILDIPGVLVAGSQVPNLLEAGAGATLVVSQDVDLLVPISVHELVKARLSAITQLTASPEEPSVWVPLPDFPLLIEVNFIGADPGIVDPIESYELTDAVLPLMVFGPLSLLKLGAPLVVDGIRLPVPRAAGIALEKLVTDRTGEKGDRDLLVVIGVLAAMSPADHDELVACYLQLPREMRHAVRTNLSILSLIDARPNMPDPRPRRAAIAELLVSLEAP